MAMIFALMLLTLLAIFGMSLLAQHLNKWIEVFYRTFLMPKKKTS